MLYSCTRTQQESYNIDELEQLVLRDGEPQLLQCSLVDSFALTYRGLQPKSERVYDQM